jgi:AcrR family transcriptional regulator
MPSGVKRSTAKTGPAKRSYDSTKRQAQARATRAAIRDAATRLFLDRGYAATTIQAIAEMAGVAPQTVYASFKTKFAVLKEALEVSIVGDDEPIPLMERADIVAISDEPDQRERARMQARAMREIQQRAAPMSLVARDAAAADPEVAAFWELGKKQRRMGMAEAARGLAGDDGLRIPVDEAADVLWVIFSPDVFMQFTRDKGWSVERYEAWVLDTLERTLLP